jgi:thioredoxin
VQVQIAHSFHDAREWVSAALPGPVGGAVNDALFLVRRLVLPTGEHVGIHGTAECVAAKDCSGKDLTGAQHHDEDLNGVDFTGANLTHANFRNANFNTLATAVGPLPAASRTVTANAVIQPGADLSGADLSGADLRNANLTGTILTGTILTGAIFTGANLTNANLTGTDLTFKDLTGATLTGANLTGTTLYGANLTNANLTGVSLSSDELRGVTLIGANLTNANLTGLRLNSFLFDLTGTTLYGANLSGADLRGANLRGKDLTNADLTGANLSNANLTGTILTGTILTGANLTNATITAPTAGTPTAGMPDTSTGVVGGAAAFSDTAGRTLTYSAPTTSSGGGTLTINATTGAFVYTPTQTQRQAATSSTTDTFTVTASNGVNTTTQTITVAVDPGTPTARGQTGGTPDTSTGVVSGGAVFTDTAGRTLTYSAPTTSAGGATVSINAATGAFVYTPTLGQRQSASFGTIDTFTVTASNGVRSTTQGITVFVRPFGELLGGMAIGQITGDASFNAYVLNSNNNNLPVVVDFWAPWCGPCKAIAPIYRELADELYGQALFFKVNVEEGENYNLAAQYARAIPTLIIFKAGQVVHTQVGMIPKAQLKQLISSYR